ncbi:uncharacterized protein LOC144424307 isoform X2 [Styela clava]
MGDSNQQPTSDDMRQYVAGSSGMDALMSAIEFQRRNLHSSPLTEGADGKLDRRLYANSAYNMMGSSQARAGVSENIQLQGDIDSERLRAAQSQAAALYSSHFSTNQMPAGVASPMWGINPMLMPFILPGLRPGLATPTQASLLSQATQQWPSKNEETHRVDDDPSQTMKCSYCAAAFSSPIELHAHVIQKHGGMPYHPTGRQHDRDISIPNDSASSRLPDAGESSRNTDPSILPAAYPGLTYLPHSGLTPTTDKLPSVHEAAAKAMRYPGPNALNPYLGLSGYQQLLAANSTGMLPSMVPGTTWSPSLAALGYPYTQANLMSRLPYLPQLGPNPLLRMPLGMDASSAPNVQPQPRETLGPKPDAASMVDPRPQSGNFLSNKESLQRRLSAPIMRSTGSPSRLPLRGDGIRGLEVNNGGPSYPSFSHRTRLPPQLIAPSVDANKPSRGPKGRIDSKSIEQHISKLISHNEKILHSPTLDKVKPRRVFRRNSLDPASLSSTPPHNQLIATHNPLTATLSAPRSLDPKYSKPLMDNGSQNSDRTNFLMVPSRLADPNPPQSISEESQSSRPFVTVLPDPRRDPHARRYIPNVPGDVPSRPPSEAQSNINMASAPTMQQPNVTQRHSFRPKDVPLRCPDCGAQFSKHDTFDIHRKCYCQKIPTVPSTNSSAMMRQSVIQHTGIQPGDASPQPQTSTVPELKVTPPEMYSEPFVNRHLESGNVKNEEIASMIRSKILENPMRFVHRDIHRTRSADAALQMSRKLDISHVNPSPSIPVVSKSFLSPSKQDANDLNDTQPITNNKSSIPTDKLPPKKKQLQLMRSSSSSKSHLDARRSPTTNDLSPLAVTSDASPISQGSKTPEASPERPPEGILNTKTETSMLQQKLIPPTNLTFSTTSSRKSLPPWIPLERDEKIDVEIGSLGPAPTIYLPETTQGAVAATTPTSSSLLPSPTGTKSPTSPRSPTRKLSPGRGSRSPSRSPTSSNLEATIPRSNYKLLLHQLSLRNMQDMGYLSEAYHHSKDKNLKRNIASLLWATSTGSNPIEGGGSPKKSRPFQVDGPKMEELYPGKASLARRLSPNSESRSKSLLTPGKVPLTQSRSRPYESSLDVRPSITRSHSAGYSSDVNNNIKQFLQNKSRNQQQSSPGNSPQQTKGHKPLTRTNANARFLLKSPTGQVASDEVKGRDSSLKGRDPLQMRKSLGRIGQSSLDGTGTQRLKETLALKRAASYNADSSVDYQTKRQRLIPISTAQAITTSRSAIPSPLMTSRLTDHDSKVNLAEKGETSASQSVSPSNPVQFNLFPHLNPRFSFEPHPTFCSLVSPQPMYVELQQSTLSMYSQWAVSQPMLLPEGMTVMDLFKNYRVLKGLSPYISYPSLFISASEKKELLKVTDTKEYEAQEKKKEESKMETKSGVDKEKTETGENIACLEKEGSKTSAGEDKMKKWIFSKMLATPTQQEKTCFTSCHNKPSMSKGFRKLSSALKLNEHKKSKLEASAETTESSKKFPKLPPPKVVIHPPSPSTSSSSDSNVENDTPTSSKTNEITALEVSDCDSDDDAIKSNQSNHFLSFKKGVSLNNSMAPSSFVPNSVPLEKNSLSESNEQNYDITKKSTEQLCNNNGEVEDIDRSSPQMTLNLSEGRLSPCRKNIDNHSDFENRNRLSDQSHESAGNSVDGGIKGQSSEGGRDDTTKRKNKKVRKSRRERNAMSPRLLKRGNGPNSPSSVFEDPSLAVHPTGACRGASEDQSTTCALCSMKAGGGKCSGTDHSNATGSEGSDEMREDDNERVNDPTSDTPVKQSPGSPLPKPLQDRPSTPLRSHTPPSGRVRTPTSTRPRTPVPLTVSVPKRNRDRSASKSSNQPLTPGILDKARGKGMTQHWVTSTDFQTIQPKSPIQVETGDEKPKQNSETKNDKLPPSKSRSFSTPEYFTAMPPNKNPVLELNLPPKTPEPSTSSTAAPNGGIQALAAVVSGVMRSAAIQSKKKTKSSKHGMTELLSHSRPLIPTSELNGSATSNHARLTEKLKNFENEENSEKRPLGDNSLGSLASLTAGVGSNVLAKQGKPSLRHLSLSMRESELFLNKANETPLTTPIEAESDGSRQEVKGQDEVIGRGEDHEFDEGQHSDGGKEDSSELDGESSSNPRPHKCLECKVAFRIAGHLAKHLRSKGHIIAMQKKTLNRLKQQKLTNITGYEGTTGGQGNNLSGSMLITSGSPEHAQNHNQDELLNQLGDGAETLARAQVRALFEGNEEYAEIATEAEPMVEGGISDEEAEFSTLGATSLAGGSDPRPFKCIACKVAFRFQGHLDRHFRSNMHLLAVGHFERGKEPEQGQEDAICDDHDSNFTQETNEHEKMSNNYSEELLEETDRILTFVQRPSNSVEVSEKNVQFFNSRSDQNHDNNNNFNEKMVYDYNDLSLGGKPVNQTMMDCDLPDKPPIKVNCVSKLTKEPINGLTSHAPPTIKTSSSDSLKNMSIKRQSPVLQSNSKSLFETPPPLPDVPLPSTSPVHNRTQLTC